ncbi:MAG: vWA domain-containing protein [Verrucomicrobiota bacterium]
MPLPDRSTLSTFAPPSICGERETNASNGDVPKPRRPENSFTWLEPKEVPPQFRLPLPMGRMNMNPGWEQISCLVDCSGSMAAKRDEVITSVNNFVQIRKKSQGDALFHISFFNDHSWSRELPLTICESTPLTPADYVPQGPTALLDVLGQALLSAYECATMLVDSERPGKVVIAVFTDGGENASQDYCTSHVARLVDYFRSKGNWEFLFFGATEEEILASEHSHH